MAVLLAVLAIVKAADYWLDRYEVTNSQRGIVQGATYSVVKAQLPAILLLILIALLTAGLYLSVVKTGSFRLPLIASALWLVVAIVGGIIYPALVQSLVVNPNQESREQPFIERNVSATRQAIGLTEVEVRNVDFGSLTPQDIENDLDPLENVRLLNPTEMKTRFLVDRGEVAGLTIDDLDVDRYPLDDDTESEEVLIAARELQLSGVTNRSWQGLHLINTRGCGLVLAPAGRVLRESAARLPHGSTRAARVVFQPHAVGLCHRQQRVVGAPVRRAAPVRGRERRPDELVHPARLLRPRLPRLQRARLGCDHAGLADVVGPRRQRPPGEAGAVPLVRHRPVSGRGRTAGRCGWSTPSPRRPATRTPSGSATCNASSRPACATTTTTSATASRPSSTPTPVRSRSTWSTIRIRSSRRGGVRSRTCSLRSTRCPRSYASTSGIRRTCSASRPTCTRSTGSTRRCSSSVTAMPGRCPRRRARRRPRRTARSCRRRPTTRSPQHSRRSPPSRTPSGSRRTTRCSTRACPKIHARTSSCCCARSCRSRRTTNAPSCRRT